MLLDSSSPLDFHMLACEMDIVVHFVVLAILQPSSFVYRLHGITCEITMKISMCFDNISSNLFLS